MALAVSRMAGSPTMFSSGSSGRFGLNGFEVVLGGDDEDLLGGEQRVQPLEGVPQEALALEEAQELLGAVLAGQRPEPGSLPASHDHRVSHRFLPKC